MSICTYLASDKPLKDAPILWPLSHGASDIYTEKPYVAQVEPELSDLTSLLLYIDDHMKEAEELEIWHIWQGIEFDPVVRSKEISVSELTVKDILSLTSSDVFATTTQYDIPVQYRIVVRK